MLIKRTINFFLKKTYISRIQENNNKVYLTFDDGPEPEITEYVLDALREYDYKATFFCTADNTEKYPKLFQKILEDGHRIGNHTFSHRNAYSINSQDFLNDVLRADMVLHTPIFRPPNGCLTLTTWLKLRYKFKIVYWTIGSGDWLKKTFDYNASMEMLRRTHPGDIILFHFSQELQNGTKKLLPAYLHWLKNNGLASDKLLI